MRHQRERLRSSLPLTPTVTHTIVHLVKAHLQDSTSLPAPGQGRAVEAQEASQSMRSRNSGGCAHSNPAKFPVGCNVQWTLVSDPPAQPMCARVLAVFLCSHFQDNLCTMLDEYVRVEGSFASLGVRRKLEFWSSKGALLPEAAGECSGKSHTNSLGRPTPVERRQQAVFQCADLPAYSRGRFYCPRPLHFPHGYKQRYEHSTGTEARQAPTL